MTGDGRGMRRSEMRKKKVTGGWKYLCDFSEFGLILECKPSPVYLVYPPEVSPLGSWLEVLKRQCHTLSKVGICAEARSG